MFPTPNKYKGEKGECLRASSAYTSGEACGSGDDCGSHDGDDDGDDNKIL